MAENVDTGREMIAEVAEIAAAATDLEINEESAVEPDDPDSPNPKSSRPGHDRLTLIFGAVVVLALVTVVGWFGWHAYQDRNQDRHYQAYLQAVRQGALNLTTIDYHHVDTDIERILSSTTGPFHDDFQQRSAPFIAAVKQAQSASTGNVTAAGIETMNDHEAQALVAVSVKTSLAGAAQPQPRGWRMRINVEKSGNEIKVSNVAFVP